MNESLNYPVQDDSRIYRSANFELDTSLHVLVEAVTIAGRKLPDSNQKPNEDAFSVQKTGETLLAAVFDGCSSQKQIEALGDESGARFASHYLKDYIYNHSTLDTRMLLLQANESLFEKSLALGAELSDVHTLPATTATALSIDATTHQLHLAHVGDTFCMILFSDGHTTLETVDRNRPYDEKIFIQIRELAKKRDISPREAKQDPTIKQAVMAMFQDSYNRPDGTGQGILNGDPKMKRYLQSSSLDLKDISAILLGSDGLIPAGMDEAKAADREKLFGIADSKGAKGLIAAKLESENEDPDWQHTRYKHSDDGTAVYLKLVPLNHR